MSRIIWIAPNLFLSLTYTLPKNYTIELMEKFLIYWYRTLNSCVVFGLSEWINEWKQFRSNLIDLD